MAYGLTKSATLAGGSNQYFTALDSASLSITGNITVETWVKFTSMPSDRAVIICKRGSATFDDYGLVPYNIQLGKNGANYDLNGCTGIGGNPQFVTYASWNPSTGVWYHVAYTRNSSSGTQFLYVNGSQVATASNTSGSGNDDALALYVGRFSLTLALNLDAELSLMRLWNTDLSGSTINSNKCTVFGSAQTNLQAEWSLDNVLTDASGNSNTFTNNNTATFTSDVPATCTVSATVLPFRSLLGVGV